MKHQHLFELMEISSVVFLYGITSIILILKLIRYYKQKNRN